jgi:hypothetical protein
MTDLPDHLGGHQGRTHNDQATLEYFINTHGITSMLDVGCGPGGQVLTALDLGLDAQGIDGDYTVDRPGDHWCIHDYTVGPSPIQKTFDLVWSCEFVEHVYEEYMPNYLADFTRGTWICMTYAPPGFPGHHHVNCQPETYWINRLQSLGYDFDVNATQEVRKISSQRKKFVKKRGLVFKKSR